MVTRKSKNMFSAEVNQNKSRTPFLPTPFLWKSPMLLSLDGRNRAKVIAESLARVTAAIRITSVRRRSYLPLKNTEFGPHRPCIRWAATQIKRLAFIRATLVPRGTAEWLARVDRVHWTLAIDLILQGSWGLPQKWILDPSAPSVAIFVRLQLRLSDAVEKSQWYLGPKNVLPPKKALRFCALRRKNASDSNELLQCSLRFGWRRGRLRQKARRFPIAIFGSGVSKWEVSWGGGNYQ